ncbi:hypothetical protein AB0B28_06335 [Glycomyces sp. NPDC046736]|uniref:hypothetical protein n=1 Tax=Glycomyces sp. NPDC046736 TaxID=3155615 RepID=UPI0033CBA035
MSGFNTGFDLGRQAGKLFGQKPNQSAIEKRVFARIETLERLSGGTVDYKQAIAAARDSGAKTVNEMFAAAKLTIAISKREDSEAVQRFLEFADSPDAKKYASTDIQRLDDLKHPGRKLAEVALATMLVFGSPANEPGSEQGYGVNPVAGDTYSAIRSTLDPDFKPEPNSSGHADITIENQGRDPRERQSGESFRDWLRRNKVVL